MSKSLRHGPFVATKDGCGIVVTGAGFEADPVFVTDDVSFVSVIGGAWPHYKAGLMAAIDELKRTAWDEAEQTVQNLLDRYTKEIE